MNKQIDYKDKFLKLQSAVSELYTAASWWTTGISKREALRLWTNVRKAADITKGTATQLGVEGKNDPA